MNFSEYQDDDEVVYRPGLGLDGEGGGPLGQEDAKPDVATPDRLYPTGMKRKRPEIQQRFIGENRSTYDEREHKFVETEMVWMEEVMKEWLDRATPSNIGRISNLITETLVKQAKGPFAKC